VEGVTLDVEAGHLGIVDLIPFGQGSRAEFKTHLEAGLGRGGGDQFDHSRPVSSLLIAIRVIE
jgi:hypothetical protein